MDNEVIYVDAEDVEVIDSPEYSCDPNRFLGMFRKLQNHY